MRVIKLVTPDGRELNPVRGSTYWPKEIKRADRVSPKSGAIRRLDRLRSTLGRLDPVVANRAWREVGDALQRISDRYSQ